METFTLYVVLFVGVEIQRSRIPNLGKEDCWARADLIDRRQREQSERGFAYCRRSNETMPICPVSGPCWKDGEPIRGG